MAKLVIVGTGTATDDMTGEEYTFPVFGLPDQEKLAKLKSSIYPTLVECHAALAATVRKMAAACKALGGDGEALEAEFLGDPCRAMEFLIEQGFYELRPQHKGSRHFEKRAKPTNGHRGPEFESHPSLGWVEVSRRFVNERW